MQVNWCKVSSLSTLPFTHTERGGTLTSLFYCPTGHAACGWSRDGDAALCVLQECVLSGSPLTDSIAFEAKTSFSFSFSSPPRTFLLLLTAGWRRGLTKKFVNVKSSRGRGKVFELVSWREREREWKSLVTWFGSTAGKTNRITESKKSKRCVKEPGCR